MGRLLKFLFGLTIGAGAALLVTPKTGREVRGMLSGSPVRGLMPARLAELSRPRDYSEPEGAATAVAEPPAPVAEPVFVPEPVAEAEPEPVAEAEPEAVVEPVFVPEPVVEAVPAEPVAEAEAEPVETEPVAESEPEPIAEAEPVFVPEPVAEAVSEPVAEAEPEPVAPDEDLRARIEETRADVATEIQKPFQVADEPTVTPALEPVAEAEPEPVAEAEPEPVAEAAPVAEAEPAPVAEAELAPVAETEAEPDHATLEANLGFVGASSALDESGERSAGFADDSPGAIDIPAVVSDDSPPQGETLPADATASEGPAVTLVPDLQTPVADSESAQSHDVWPADPVPATFEPELVEEPAAEPASAAEPVAPESSEGLTASETPVAAEPVEAPEEPIVAEAPVVAEPVETPVAPVKAETVIAEAPVVAEPVVAEAPVEVVEPVIAEAPVAAEPVVAEAPVAAEPLHADESAPEEPADEAPLGNIDQAEMRRRIEETRARLKAKAFDAMMSGEAALLARDSGEKPVPRGADVPVDHDVAETLDESLSQDDY